MDRMFVYPLPPANLIVEPVPSVVAFGGEAFWGSLGLGVVLRVGPPWWY